MVYSRGMIENAVAKTMSNEDFIRRIITDADKHILFKLMHGQGLGSLEKQLKATLEEVGCSYPNQPS